ncbi:MAG: hypothetical protein RLZZ597_3303 [Cyanobacteriota bacterium]|jgi:hypothetical protein
MKPTLLLSSALLRLRVMLHAPHTLAHVGHGFVQYENFYEPVDVTIGSTQGDLISVTEGLSVGEQ